MDENLISDNLDHEVLHIQEVVLSGVDPRMHWSLKLTQTSWLGGRSNRDSGISCEAHNRNSSQGPSDSEYICLPVRHAHGWSLGNRGLAFGPNGLENSSHE